MSALDMRHVWQPTLKPSSYKRSPSHKRVSWSASVTANSRSQRPLSTLKRSQQSKPEVAATRGHELLTQPEGDRVRAQGQSCDSINSDSNADDDLPSLEEFWGRRISKVEYRNDLGNNHGTRDSPVILEDDEPNPPSLSAPAVSASVDAGTDSTFEPNMHKPTDPPTCNTWYDLESGRYVTEDSPLPQLEKDGLVSTLTGHLDLDCHSPVLYDQISQPDNGNTCTPKEPGPGTVPEPLGEHDRGEMDENGCQLERDLLLAFEEQENPTLAITPSPPYLHRQSTKPPPAQIDQEPDQIRTDNGGLEVRHGSPLRSPHRGEVAEESPEQRQEVAADVVQEIEDNGGESEQGEKRRRQDKQEATSNIHTAESSSGTHSTIDDDNDNKAPRPAKRRRQDGVQELDSDIRASESNNEDDDGDQELRPANWRRLRRLRNMDKAPTPLDDWPSKSRRLGQSHSATPPPTQLGIDSAQPRADHYNPLTLVNNDEHDVSRTSQSPSATREPVPAAEYCEWPFQGFLKHTRIGNKATYNLEFTLPCIMEHLRLPILTEAFGTGPGQEVLTEPTPHGKTFPHSKVYSAASPTQKKRARWTPEDNARLLKMKTDGCSWKIIHAAFPHRSKESIQVHYSTKVKE